MQYTQIKDSTVHSPSSRKKWQIILYKALMAALASAAFLWLVMNVIYPYMYLINAGVDSFQELGDDLGYGILGFGVLVFSVMICPLVFFLVYRFSERYFK